MMGKKAFLHYSLLWTSVLASLTESDVSTTTAVVNTSGVTSIEAQADAALQVPISHPNNKALHKDDIRFDPISAQGGILLRNKAITAQDKALFELFLDAEETGPPVTTTAPVKHDPEGEPYQRMTQWVSTNQTNTRIPVTSKNALLSYDKKVAMNVIKRIGPWAQQKHQNQRKKWNFRTKNSENRVPVDCSIIDLKVALILDGSLPLFDRKNGNYDLPNPGFLSNEQLSELAGRLKNVSGRVEFDVTRIRSDPAMDASMAYTEWTSSSGIDDAMVRYYTPFEGESRSGNVKRKRNNWTGPGSTNKRQRDGLAKYADIHVLPPTIQDYSKLWKKIESYRANARTNRTARLDPHHKAMLKLLEEEAKKHKDWYNQLLTRDGVENWETLEPNFEVHEKRPLPTPVPLDWREAQKEMEYEEGPSWQHMGYKIPRMHIKGDPRPEWKSTGKSTGDAGHTAQDLASANRMPIDCANQIIHWSNKSNRNMYRSYEGLVDSSKVTASLGNTMASDFMRINTEWWSDEQETRGPLEDWFDICLTRFEKHCNTDPSGCSGFVVSSQKQNPGKYYCAVLESNPDIQTVKWTDDWITTDGGSDQFTTYVFVEYTSDCKYKMDGDSIELEDEDTGTEVTEQLSGRLSSNTISRRLQSIGATPIASLDPALSLREHLLDQSLWGPRTGTYAFYSNDKENRKLMNLVLLVTDRSSEALRTIDGKATIESAVEGVHSSIILVHKSDTSTMSAEGFSTYGDWLWSSNVPDNGGDVMAVILDENMLSSAEYTSGTVIMSGIEKSVRNFLANYYRCITPTQKLKTIEAGIKQSLVKDFSWIPDMSDSVPMPNASPKVRPEQESKKPKKKRISHTMPPTAYSHEPQWYGALTQVFNPCIHVHESNTTFPIWVGGNWNLFDKEAWARYGNVFAGGAPDWSSQTWTNPNRRNNQAFDFYNYDAGFVDLEGGVCGNMLSSGDGQLRDPIGSLYQDEWYRPDDETHPYQGDWRNYWLTGRMHDEAMRRNATQAYRLSVYHPREVVNTKVGRFSAPGYNRWAGGETGWGLMRQARYGKYQPESVLTEPQWSIGQRNGYYERATKQFWRTGGFRSAGVHPESQLVDFSGKGYWGQRPADAKVKIAYWKNRYRIGLTAPQHANGLHLITPEYFAQHGVQSGLTYDEWINKYYVPIDLTRGNLSRNSPNYNIKYNLESPYNQSVYNLDGPLGFKDIHRLDSRRKGKTVQGYNHAFEHNEKFYTGYKNKLGKYEMTPPLQAYDGTDFMIEVYKRFSPAGELTWMAGQNRAHWNTYLDLTTFPWEKALSNFASPFHRRNYNQQVTNMNTVARDGDIQDHTKSVPWMGNERYRFPINISSAGAVARPHENKSCLTWTDKACDKRIPEPNHKSYCVEPVLTMEQMLETSYVWCNDAPWVDIPGLSSDVPMFPGLRQDVLFRYPWVYGHEEQFSFSLFATSTSTTMAWLGGPDVYKGLSGRHLPQAIEDFVLCEDDDDTCIDPLLDQEEINYIEEISGNKIDLTTYLKVKESELLINMITNDKAKPRYNHSELKKAFDFLTHKARGSRQKVTHDVFASPGLNKLWNTPAPMLSTLPPELFQTTDSNLRGQVRFHSEEVTINRENHWWVPTEWNSYYDPDMWITQSADDPLSITKSIMIGSNSYPSKTMTPLPTYESNFRGANPYDIRSDLRAHGGYKPPKLQVNGNSITRDVVLPKVYSIDDIMNTLSKDHTEQSSDNDHDDEVDADPGTVAIGAASVGVVGIAAGALLCMRTGDPGSIHGDDSSHGNGAIIVNQGQPKNAIPHEKFRNEPQKHEEFRNNLKVIDAGYLLKPAAPNSSDASTIGVRTEVINEFH